MKILYVAALLSLGLTACASTEKLDDDGVVTIIAGGDLQWSQRVRTPSYYFGVEDNNSLLREDGWRRLPYVASNESAAHIEEKFGRKVETDKVHYKTARQYELKFESDRERDRYPLVKLADVFRAANVALVNLETPLTDRGRLSGAFRTPPSFAKALKWAGIDVVATANNHAFDAEGVGIDDTIKALEKAEIQHVGTGENLAAATEPAIVDAEGVRIAFLAYTYGVNPTRSVIGFATTELSGAAPLDPFLIERDIERFRDSVDLLIVSLHWGLENKPEVHAAAREFAHSVIDAGADIIIGHHPHLPRGIETYKNGLIAYSLGNLAFGHGHDNWTDNFLLRVTADKQGWRKTEIIPIAGAGADILQPFQIFDARADELLQTLRERSKALDSDFHIENDIGVALPQHR